jgi:hypothetical protein
VHPAFRTPSLFEGEWNDQSSGAKARREIAKL